jgi:hypothetical protein
VHGNQQSSRVEFVTVNVSSKSLGLIVDIKTEEQPTSENHVKLFTNNAIGAFHRESS